MEYYRSNQLLALGECSAIPFGDMRLMKTHPLGMLVLDARLVLELHASGQQLFLKPLVGC